MTEPRDRRPLSDAALDRAIEQALAVEPSPAFVARVRHRVSIETRPRERRVWLVFGLAACAIPVLLLALYVALLGGIATPHIAGRPEVAGLASVPLGHDGDQAPAYVSPEEPEPPTPHDGARPLVRRAARAFVPEAVAGARHVIVMPDVVISEREVSAVLGLSESPVLESEELPDDAKNRIGEAVDGSALTALDVAELIIPSLAIEPLQLSARVQGERE